MSKSSVNTVSNHVFNSKPLNEMSASELVEWLEAEVRYNHYDYGLPGKPTIHSIDELKEEIVSRLNK